LIEEIGGPGPPGDAGVQDFLRDGLQWSAILDCTAPRVYWLRP
jgi:hypothetical protein